MKKAITICAAAVLMMGAMPLTTFAHGNCGRGTTTQAYSLCSVDNCNTAGSHKHNGTTYAGHTKNDGHTYHNNSGGYCRSHR